MKKVVAAVLIGGFIGAFALPASASKPAKVFTDPAGDAGLGGSSVAIFPPAGFDILEGTIARNKTNLEFTVTHAAMPPIGTLPEAFRFLWAFTVGKTEYRLNAKSADIGKPDLLAMNGNERVGQVDVDGHFRLEGECAAGSIGPQGLVNCQPLEYLEGSFDPAAASFTVIVPMASVKAKTGSKIAQSGGVGSGICSICWITHLAERSHGNTIIDEAIQLVTYRVPKK